MKRLLPLRPAEVPAWFLRGNRDGLERFSKLRRAYKLNADVNADECNNASLHRFALRFTSTS